MRNRILAALLALFFGSFGVHKFYLRDTGAGIFYIILMAIGSSIRLPISTILGWIDALVLFTMTDEKFDKKYNKKYQDRYDSRDRRYENRSQRRYPPRKTYSDRPSRGGYEVRDGGFTTPPPNRPKPKPRRIRENPFKKTGISKYKDFDLEGAIEDFNKGLELDPHDIALHFNLACAYSLTEKAEKSYQHISQAVENGFKDIEKIRTHDDLAYLRIQEGFDEFAENGFKLKTETKEIPVTDKKSEEPKEEKEEKSDKIPESVLKDDVLLSQLNKLSELRNKGLLSDKEYHLEKEKLMRR